MGCWHVLADDLAFIGEDDRFCRRGPHVKSHQKCHVQNLRERRGGDVVIIRRAGAGQSDQLPSMATFRYGDHRRPASNTPDSLAASVREKPGGRVTCEDAWSNPIDLDVATQPLLGVIRSLVNVDDIDDPRLARLTRDDRYETITCLAEDNLRAGNTVLLVAPFTEERRTLRAWEARVDRLHRAAGGTVIMIWLYLSREELLQRMRDRGADRDEPKLSG